MKYSRKWLPVEIAVKREWTDVLPLRREIVVVEDDQIIRELIVEILDSVDAVLVVFATADDALHHVQTSHQSCSLLITDHGLPGKKSGLELAEMVRVKWPDVPVILTSGYEMDTAALPQGVMYLQKPWSLDLLTATVERILP